MNSVKQDTLRLWATPIYQQTLDNGGLELIKQLAVEELDQDFNFLKDLQDIRPWSTHDLLHQKKEWELVANWLAQQADLALTDQGFKYEAELPVGSLPAQRPVDLPAEIRFGATPEG